MSVSKNRLNTDNISTMAIQQTPFPKRQECSIGKEYRYNEQCKIIGRRDIESTLASFFTFLSQLNREQPFVSASTSTVSEATALTTSHSRTRALEIEMAIAAAPALAIPTPRTPTLGVPVTTPTIMSASASLAGCAYHSRPEKTDSPAEQPTQRRCTSDI